MLHAVDVFGKRKFYFVGIKLIGSSFSAAFIVGIMFGFNSVGAKKEICSF